MENQIVPPREFSRSLRPTLYKTAGKGAAASSSDLAAAVVTLPHENCV